MVLLLLLFNYAVCILFIALCSSSWSVMGIISGVVKFTATNFYTCIFHTGKYLGFKMVVRKESMWQHFRISDFVQKVQFKLWKMQAQLWQDALISKYLFSVCIKSSKLHFYVQMFYNYALKFHLSVFCRYIEASLFYW